MNPAVTSHQPLGERPGIEPCAHIPSAKQRRVAPYRIDVTSLPLEKLREALALDLKHHWGESNGHWTIYACDINYHLEFVHGIPGNDSPIKALVAKHESIVPLGSWRLEEAMETIGIKCAVSTLFTLPDTYDPFDL